MFLENVALSPPVAVAQSAAPTNTASTTAAAPSTEQPALSRTYLDNTFSVLASPELGWQPSIPSSAAVMLSGRWSRGLFVATSRLGAGIGGGVYPVSSLTTLRVGISVGVGFPVHRIVTMAVTGGYDLHAGTDWLGGGVLAHRFSAELTASVQPWNHVVLDVFGLVGAFQSFQVWQPTLNGGVRIGFWWSL